MTQENEIANAPSVLEDPNAPSVLATQEQIPQQDGGTETTKQPVDDIMAKIWGDETPADDSNAQSEDTAVPEDFKVNYPEGMPEEYAQEFDKMFAQHQIPSEKAQQITDMMAEITDKQEKKSEANLIKQAWEDTQRLKEEFGSGFARKDANVKRFIDRSGLEKEDVASLAYAVGKYKAWKLLAKLSVFTAEGEGVSANPRNAPVSAPKDFDKMFSDPEFIDKRRAGDADANKKIRQWAIQQAQQDQ